MKMVCIIMIDRTYLCGWAIKWEELFPCFRMRVQVFIQWASTWGTLRKLMACPPSQWTGTGLSLTLNENWIQSLESTGREWNLVCYFLFGCLVSWLVHTIFLAFRWVYKYDDTLPLVCQILFPYKDNQFNRISITEITKSCQQGQFFFFFFFQQDKTCWKLQRYPH